jgi:hypothetical protein
MPLNQQNRSLWHLFVNLKLALRRSLAPDLEAGDTFFRHPTVDHTSTGLVRQ